MATATLEAGPRFVPAPVNFGISGSDSSGTVPAGAYLGASSPAPVTPSPPSASSPRFVPAPSAASRSLPLTSGGGDSPSPRFSPETPVAPTSLEQGLSLAKIPTSFASMFAPESGAGAVGGALNVTTGIQDLLRGRTAPGALSITGGTGALLRSLGLGGPVASALGGVAGVGGAALNFSQGNPRGVESVLTGGAQLANLFPASATLGGVPVSLAGGAASAQAAAAAAGADALLAGGPVALTGGGEAATMLAGGAEALAGGTGASLSAGASLAGAFGGLAIPFVAFIIKDLVNMALGEYKQGDLSKRIMAAKQTSAAQYGNQAQEEAIKAAPSFQAAWLALSAAPAGTSGQVQFGIGDEYAGMTKVGAGGTTQTPKWSSIVKVLSDPATLATQPDLVASAIQNLWVQKGQGGATAFDAGATRDYQTYLLSKLPNTPEWLAAKQKILGAEPVDPRDHAARDRALAASPDLPIIANTLQVKGLRIPTDHEYLWGNGATMAPISPERVAQVGTANVFDKTTGQWVGGGNAGPATAPAYLAPRAGATVAERYPEIAASLAANPALTALLRDERTTPEALMRYAPIAAGRPLGAEDYAAITGDYTVY